MFFPFGCFAVPTKRMTAVASVKLAIFLLTIITFALMSPNGFTVGSDDEGETPPDPRGTVFTSRELLENILSFLPILDNAENAFLPLILAQIGYRHSSDFREPNNSGSKLIPRNNRLRSLRNLLIRNPALRNMRIRRASDANSFNADNFRFFVLRGMNNIVRQRLNRDGPLNQDGSAIYQAEGQPRGARLHSSSVTNYLRHARNNDNPFDTLLRLETGRLSARGGVTRVHPPAETPLLQMLLISRPGSLNTLRLLRIPGQRHLQLPRTYPTNAHTSHLIDNILQDPNASSPVEITFVIDNIQERFPINPESEALMNEIMDLMLAINTEGYFFTDPRNRPGGPPPPPPAAGAAGAVF